LVDELRALINSKPRTPTKVEMLEVVEKYWPPTPVAGCQHPEWHSTDCGNAGLTFGELNEASLEQAIMAIGPATGWIAYDADTDTWSSGEFETYEVAPGYVFDPATDEEIEACSKLICAMEEDEANRAAWEEQGDRIWKLWCEAPPVPKIAAPEKFPTAAPDPRNWTPIANEIVCKNVMTPEQAKALTTPHQPRSWNQVFRTAPGPGDGAFRFDPHHGTEYWHNERWTPPKIYLEAMRELGKGPCVERVQGFTWAHISRQQHAFSPGVWYDSAGLAYHVNSCERCGAHEPGCLPELPKRSSEKA
jgi:hypothetical protein